MQQIIRGGRLEAAAARGMQDTRQPKVMMGMKMRVTSRVQAISAPMYASAQSAVPGKYRIVVGNSGMRAATAGQSRDTY